MFKGEDILEFTSKFQTDLDCLFYLAEIKWSQGFTCVKCGHIKHTIRKYNLARDCNRCHHIESPTANTLFHKTRFGLRKAFMIMFEMSASTRGLSSSQVAKRYSISRTTAWSFMHKIRIAMKSSNNHPIEGAVQVDEFVYGGKETLKQGRSTDSKKKKIVGAVSITKTGKVDRVYFKRIEDYSSKSLKVIFDEHISVEAKVFTDKWSGYKPIMNTYDITQKDSDNGAEMKQMHTIIHQLKSWLRSIYSWVHKDHIEKYLDEFSFRINRSIFKQTIFHKLCERMVESNHTSYQKLKVSA